jgi:radical SAM superfamily enzyme YgiQ (UPF0313 family)
MLIYLIHPYFLDSRLDAEDIQSPPIGMYYIAAALKEGGHTVAVRNWHDRRGGTEDVAAELGVARPRVVGFSIVHANRWGGIDIARIAKRVDPSVTTVFGGVGATHLWSHLLGHFPEVDYVVLGEGEIAFAELCAAVAAGDRAGAEAVAGIAYRRRGRPVKTAAPPPIPDLDALPMPARHFDLPHLALTRGCVSGCAFCGSPAFWGRRVRSHSASYFVAQMAALRRRGRRFVHVSDDTFTRDRRRAIEVCRGIVDQKLDDVSWTAISRVDAVDEDVLAWMRRAGCIQISYGVESGSAEIRRRLNKRISDEQIRLAFALTQRYGIMARAYFIYGCPGESHDTIRETIDLMLSIQPLGAVFYILDLFPGTALYADMQRRLGLTDDIWLERVEDIMYFETDAGLTPEMILEFGRTLRQSFYANLGRFAAALDPIDLPEFQPLHADFFSRLAMTFHQGDYARVEAIEGKPRLAEGLYRRALRHHPHARAYLGLGLLRQAAGRFEESIQILAEGLAHFPHECPLNLCCAVSHMNLGRYGEAIDLLGRCPGEPEAVRLTEACRKAAGRS